MNTTNPTTQAERRYLREFAFAVVSYVLVLWLSLYGLNHGVAGVWRYVIAGLPAVPVAGVLVAAVRFLRATDEYQRQLAITALAIAGGATALVDCTYAFLENAGLPRMSIWTSFIVFMAIWLIATAILRWRTR